MRKWIPVLTLLLFLSGCALHLHYHAPVKIQDKENQLLDEVLEDLNDGTKETSMEN